MRTRRYPGCVERRGDKMRVILTLDGARHRFLVNTRDERAAEQFARTKYAELTKQAERQRDGLPGPVKISALIDQFERDELPRLAPNTARTYKVTLKEARKFFSGTLDLSIDRVSAGHVKQFLSWRAARRLRKGQSAPVAGTLSPRTQQKERTTLHTLFALAEECEYREGNPVAKTRRPKADPRSPVILNDDEYGRLLLECTDSMLYLYVMVLAEAGLRDESEALWLRWEDVDLQEGFLRVVSGRGGHRTKGGRSRSVPLTKRLADAFRAYRTKHDNVGWVFAHPITARRHLVGERINSLRGSVMAAAKRAGIEPAWHPHDLRHRRVTTWLSQQKSAALVQQALGHADLRTTMAYAHLVPAHLKALVDEPMNSSF